MSKIHRRLEALEDRLPDPDTSDRTEVRKKMSAFFKQLARLRRGELGPEEAAACRATLEAVEGRIKEMRQQEPRRGGGS